MFMKFLFSWHILNSVISKLPFSKFKLADALIIDLSSNGIINKTVDFPYLMYPDQAHFYNLKGISTTLLGSPLFNFNSSSEIAFVKSSFDLYDEYSRLVDAEKCDADYFEDRNIMYFHSSNDLGVHLFMNTNYFQRPICPYVFKNCKIQILFLHDYGHQQLFSNTINFFPIKNLNNRTININCQIFIIGFINIYSPVIDTSSTKSFLFLKAENVAVSYTHLTLPTKRIV